MPKRTLLACTIAAMLPVIASASVHPVVTLSLGSDRANVYSNKSITLIAPFQNAYIGNNHYDTEMVAGVFAGAEIRFLKQWAWQIGLSYYQSSSFGETGNVYQFSDPAFNNLTYQYQIQSRRVSIDTKISHTCHGIWHPYITAGLGEAINETYGYMEMPVTSADVPMAEPFAGHTAHSFTYAVGLGVDVDLNEHLRFGAGYRFIDLGSASLGTTPLQSSTNTISNQHIHMNEVLAQLSFVG